jgi:fermentation-respiration switch protein FrsA (DUF1100 family)
MGSLVSRVVFMPPTKHLDIDSENDTFLTTSHGALIQMKKIIKDKNYLYLIISHGNAENVEFVYAWAENHLAKNINVNIIMYEYTGYGKRDEKNCSEQFVYNDIDAVYSHLTNELKVPTERIIVYGRSVGSGPSCYLAEKYPNIGGLILNCGFMSAYRVLFKFRFTLPGDMFPNIDRMKNIRCPVCIFHSIKDEIVPFYHGKEMYKAAKNKFDPLFIDGTNHNNIDKVSDDVFRHMEKFFKHIDPNYKEVVIEN